MNSERSSRLAVLDGCDIDWISEAVEIVEQLQGQPWRVAYAAFDAFGVHPAACSRCAPGSRG